MEESGDDDSYGSFFDIDNNQYPNLSANFSYDSPGFYLNQDVGHHQMEQDQHQEPLASFRSGQVLQQFPLQPQQPLQPLQPLQQPQQFSAVNVNLLSLQPLPQGKRSEQMLLC